MYKHTETNSTTTESKNAAAAKSLQTCALPIYNISSTLTLYEAYTNHWTKLRKAEIKRKKEFNLEAWEKETSNTIS